MFIISRGGNAFFALFTNFDLFAFYDYRFQECLICSYNIYKNYFELHKVQFFQNRNCPALSLFLSFFWLEVSRYLDILNCFEITIHPRFNSLYNLHGLNKLENIYSRSDKIFKSLKKSDLNKKFLRKQCL